MCVCRRVLYVECVFYIHLCCFIKENNTHHIGENNTHTIACTTTHIVPHAPPHKACVRLLLPLCPLCGCQKAKAGSTIRHAVHPVFLCMYVCRCVCLPMYSMYMWFLYVYPMHMIIQCTPHPQHAPHLNTPTTHTLPALVPPPPGSVLSPPHNTSLPTPAHDHL